MAASSSCSSAPASAPRPSSSRRAVFHRCSQRGPGLASAGSVESRTVTLEVSALPSSRRLSTLTPPVGVTPRCCTGSGSVGVLAPDEPEEGALLAARLVLLVEEGEVLGVELLEPRVPVDGLQAIVAGAAGEVDAQHSGLVAVLSAPNRRRLAVVLLDPPADLVVVGGRVRKGCH